MVEGGTGGTAAALRALRAASDEIDALSRGTLSPEGQRRHILRVANAVDRSLRRLLRDDERAELSLRLQALAPDEIRPDAVLGELRRNDRLPVEVAASIHELFEIRRALEGGAPPARGDAERAVRAAQGLDAAILHPPAAPPDAAAWPDEELEPDEPPYAAPEAGRSGRRRGLTLAGLVGVAAVVALAVSLLGRGPDHLGQGIALFDEGRYADAAHHFYRHAQENPDDVTPQLYLARIHRRMDRPELAAEALREAQRIAPEDAAVHRELGFLLLDGGRPDVAVDRFQRALELDDGSAEGWVGLIRALRAAGRGAEAEAALARAPADVRALLTRPDST